MNIRLSAQALHSAALFELHQGNLASALENLEALQACARVYADEPSLVIYMIRVAVMGLATNACWDALQDPRWIEPQLARLQQACQSGVRFAQIPHVMAAERLTRVHQLEWFAAHSSQALVDRCAPIYKSFGGLSAELNTANLRGQWRRRVFHPAWSYAWRAQEELDHLQYSQRELAVLREAVARGSWADLKKHQAALRDGYRLPPALWRFYLSIPLLEFASTIVGSPTPAVPVCPYPNFSRAWRVTARNLTQHELMTTVLALQRHRLRHGQVPATLAALVPEYLSAVPHDLMEGQPLRYRLNADNSFILYSVGEDAHDDGGDSRPSDADLTRSPNDPWRGRDWVWPQAAIPSNSPE